MIDATCEKIFKLNQENKTVEYIICNNVGENQGLNSHLQIVNCKIPIKYEFTGHDIAQRNHLVEVGLAMIASRDNDYYEYLHDPKRTLSKILERGFSNSNLLRRISHS
jgi:hypothetical protein